MSLETTTGSFWELSQETEAAIRGEAEGAPVPTLQALLELGEIEPEARALGKAITRTAERLVAHAAGGQRADLARLRAADADRPYRGADPVWFRLTRDGPWVMALVSHYDRGAELWCIRLVASALVTYADETALRPRVPGEIAPGQRRFGP